jgi:hypothetical protein
LIGHTKGGGTGIARDGEVRCGPGVDRDTRFGSRNRGICSICDGEGLGSGRLQGRCKRVSAVVQERPINGTPNESS